MPCISSQFDPNIGPIINVGISVPGALHAGAGEPRISAFPLLIDTGASITCISPRIAQVAQLVPRGKQPVTVPSGTDSLNTYLVDLALPFGVPSGQLAPAYLANNILVMEFLGDTTHYQGLLGRDIICKGHLTVTGYDNRFTFCL